MVTAATITELEPAQVGRPADDVVVVGGGVAGLACARALLDAGRGVRVLEARTLGSGASHGNCGTLTPSHAPPLAAPGTVMTALRWMLVPDAPLYIPPRLDPHLWRWLWRFALHCNVRDWRASAHAKHALLEDSRARIESWIARDGLQCEFTRSGEDYVFRDPRAFEHEMAEVPLLRELGIELELLDGAACEAGEPALKPGVAGAIRFSGDAALRPDHYVDELARVVRTHGGVIDEGRAFTGIERIDGGVRVQTSQGPLDARDVVVASGAWSPLLARVLGQRWLRGVIQPGKGYSITYDAPPMVPRRPLVLRDHSVCVTAWGNSYRLGSTMEFSGYDATLNPRRLAALERGAHAFLHEPVGPAVRERWCGWRPMCVDDVPLIGAVPGAPGVWLATGHGMMGVGMSAGTGQLLADLMTGRDPAIDPHPYRPARFA